MSAAISSPPAVAHDQRFILRGIRWDQYVAIADALPDRAGLRICYARGSLTFLTKSHRHEWLAECFGTMVLAVASGCDVECQVAGSTTFRREDVEAGAEGDKTFYFGANAERLRGPREIDLNVDPPPDLVIEVEVTHPADGVMATWAGLGVPEVWRFDADRHALSFWLRREDGLYVRADRGLALPTLDPAEVVEQIRLAEELGLSRWSARLAEWVRDVVAPRGR